MSLRSPAENENGPHLRWQRTVILNAVKDLLYGF
jgi:hypothetical protein